MMVRTNKDGKFYFPQLFRFAFFRCYTSIIINVDAIGYKGYSQPPIVINIKAKDELKKLKNIVYELMPIKTEEEFAKQCKIWELERELKIKICKRFLRLYPNSKDAPEVHYHLALAYDGQKKWNMALKEYRKITKLYPEDNHYVKLAFQEIEYRRKSDNYKYKDY